MKLKSKEGTELYKRLTVRIVPPRDQKAERQIYIAPPGRGFGPLDIQSVLERTADQLERANPLMEFRLVELAPNRFNFVYERAARGSRASDGSSPSAKTADARELHPNGPCNQRGA